jgi:ATP-dependent RNA helicase DDX56/DBP9
MKVVTNILSILSHSLTPLFIPKGLLMSATLSPDLDKFKAVLLHNAVILKLEEELNTGLLHQFYLKSSESDKFLILYVFLKLGLLQVFQCHFFFSLNFFLNLKFTFIIYYLSFNKGKGLIFANDVNKCYRIKLFLQQFYISAAVLNSEVPLNSRVHIIEEYNRGVFDYLIAT